MTNWREIFKDAFNFGYAPPFDEVFGGGVFQSGKKYKEVTYMKGKFGLAFGVLVVVAVLVAGWFFVIHKGPVSQEKKPTMALVTLIIGDVKVERNGSQSWQPLVIGDVVGEKDKIKTGPDSSCELQIEPGSIYKVKEKTEMLISKLMYDPATGKSVNRLELAVGKVFAKPKRTQESLYEIATPTAVAAVRGTVFAVESDEKGHVKVAVAKGKVAVKPRLEITKKKLAETIGDEKKAEEIVNEKIASAVEVEVSAGEETKVDPEKIKKVDEQVAQKVKEVVEEVKVEAPTGEAAKEGTPEAKAHEEKKMDLIAKVVEEKVEKVIAPEVKKTVKEEVIEKKQIDKKVEEELIQEVGNRDVVVEVKREVKEPEVKLAYLTITGSDKTVKVFLDDAFVGNPPVELALKLGKEYKVKAMKDDKIVFEKTVSYTEQKKEELNVDKMVEEMMKKEKEAGKEEQAKEEENKIEEVVKKEPVEVLWSRGGGVVGTPVKVGKNIYVATYSGWVYGYRANGKVFWAGKAEGKCVWSPSVWKGYVAVGTKVNSSTYKVSLFKIGSKKPLWSKNVSKMLYKAHPVVNNGAVFSTHIDGLTVFDLEGNEIYSVKTGGAVYTAPAVSGNKVVVVDEKGTAKGIDWKAKKVVWTYSVGTRVISSHPIVIGNKVIFGDYKGYLHAVNLNNGNRVWKVKIANKIHSEPIYGDGVVAVLSGGKLVVVNPANGKVMWSKQVGKGGVAIGSGKVYFVSKNGKLSVFALKTGAEQFTHSAKVGGVSGLAVVGDSIIATGKKVVGLKINK